MSSNAVFLTLFCLWVLAAVRLRIVDCHLTRRIEDVHMQCLQLLDAASPEEVDTPEFCDAFNKTLDLYPEISHEVWLNFLLDLRKWTYCQFFPADA